MFKRHKKKKWVAFVILKWNYIMLKESRFTQWAQEQQVPCFLFVVKLRNIANIAPTLFCGASKSQLNAPPSIHSNTNTLFYPRWKRAIHSELGRSWPKKNKALIRIVLHTWWETEWRALNKMKHFNQNRATI